MSKPHYVLDVRTGDAEAQVHELSDEQIVIGRSKAKADLFVDDRRVSSRHVQLTFRDGKVTALDLGSTNKTVFKETVQDSEFEIPPGASIRIGETTIRLMAIHGLKEDVESTVMMAPPWLREDQDNEEDVDSTRALNADQIAELAQKTALSNAKEAPITGLADQSTPVPDDNVQETSYEQANGVEVYDEEDSHLPIVEPEPESEALAVPSDAMMSGVVQDADAELSADGADDNANHTRPETIRAKEHSESAAAALNTDGEVAVPAPQPTEKEANSVATDSANIVDTGNLKFKLEHRPEFALLTAYLEADQHIYVEPSAMVSMTPNIHLQAGLKGGLLKSIGRGFGGESVIINTFTAQNEPGELVLAPGPMGDMHHYRLNGNRVLLQRGAYVANTEGVEVDGKWAGFKGFFSGEGMVLLQAHGTGDLFFSTYGAMLEVDVTGQYYVDTGYIVAFEDTLDYKVTLLPGLSRGSKLKSFFFGGEGLVCQFNGHGKLWVQTRTVHPFLNFVNPFRRIKNRG